MNRNKLKSYAPEARRDFIAAVTARAAHYGLTAKKIEPMTGEGDVVLIAGSPFSQAVGEKRKKLEARINQLGFEQTMEAMAYTWFNRLVAIRYMELHGYLDHGFRVLSHPEGHAQPEIVEHAEHVDLPGLDKQKVIELKLDGTKEEELYRLLLIGQCNALSRAMPFLFESIDDETELLLPDHLLHSDSLIRKLVNEIVEEDWQEVEIIGWLYQFYISEKKDEVIGKVVKSEDIPAATQLFTPNWIVKYLVQNSLGRQWMATYPNSPLKGQMEYYIEPAEQPPEVQAKLAEITPDSLNPEELTLLDPACGSGHILVEAYDLLKVIYQERGYRAKDIPRLILEKNLYGLEIDDRAAQLAAFALVMTARADDRNIFERDVQPHVLSIQESKGLDAKEITEALNQPILEEEPPPSGELFEEIADEKSPLFSKKAMGVAGGISQADVAQLIELFEHGKTFGSLIQVPASLVETLPAMTQRVQDVIGRGGLFEQPAARSLNPFVHQAHLLATKYYVVVANPPYMGTGSMNDYLKGYVERNFWAGRADLCMAFMLRAFGLLAPNGLNAQVNLQKWMFQSSFSQLRRDLLQDHCIDSLVQIGFNSFPTLNSKIALACAFVLRKHAGDGYWGKYVDLNSVPRSTDKGELFLTRDDSEDYVICQDQFQHIPESRIAYWGKYGAVFSGDSLETTMVSGGRCKTHADHLFVRFVWEVSMADVGGEGKWKFYEKGGDFRRWYGNRLFVVDWSDAARSVYASKGGLTQEQFWGRPGVTWSDIAVQNGFRLKLEDTEYSSVSPTIFPSGQQPLDFRIFLFLNSSICQWLLKALNPSIHANPGDILDLPLIALGSVETAKRAIELSRKDWDSQETSFEFSEMPLIASQQGEERLAESVERAVSMRLALINDLKGIEESNNRRFVDHFNLVNDCDIDVPLSAITLSCNPAYRSKGRLLPDLGSEIANDLVQECVSYGIGCMMGRFSLDLPGLIYAHCGNVGFDQSKYDKFKADEDGIVPLTEFHWFEDDAASRFGKFVATAWPKDHLEENLKFVAESLGERKGESPRETIRRYLAADFFKHHLSKYKKRPIYWLFSSGKQRGFQALVYLHRYNEGTLARMRTEYVIPLLGKMTARIDHLTDDIAAATSSQHRKRLEKEKATVTKQLAEVQAFDEKLRHFADQRITLDLDDGVKANYGKFGTLLAEVKAVTGKKAED